MLKSNEGHLRQALSDLGWIFILVMIVCGAIGVACLFGSVRLEAWYHSIPHDRSRLEFGAQLSKLMSQHNGPASPEVAKMLQEWEDGLSEQHMGPEIIRDLGIALLSGVFVTLAVELYAGIRLRKQIAGEVLQAAYEKVVPETIFKEVADSVFRSDVIWRQWTVDMVVLLQEEEPELYKGLREHHGEHTHIIRSTIAYSLENLNDKAIPYPVSGGIDLDIPVEKSGLPQFENITLGSPGENYPITPAQSIEALTKTPEVPISTVGTSRRKITLQQRPNQLRFDVEVEIPARGTFDVRYVVKRAIRVPGIFVLVASAPADGIRIKARGRNVTFQVIPFHPHRNDLANPGPGEWVFDRGMLPWQGVEIRSSSAQAIDREPRV